MKSKHHSIKIPRNQFRRGIVRLVGRIVLPLVAKIKIVGKENFPKTGPLILIGNHAAVMEPVLMAVYSPQQLEFLGSIDVPHEPTTQAAVDFYEMIPVFRGKPERKSLKQSLEVLEQKGFLAIFPEGGLWNPGQMQAKTGVSFLSHRGNAPVLPIAFLGVEGALNAIFQLKRPEITMIIGKVIPAFSIGKEEDLKKCYELYAETAMNRVFELLPAEIVAQMADVENEEFALQIRIDDTDGEVIEIPGELKILHGQSLAMLLHQPAILKIFKVNLKMPVEPIQQLHLKPPAEHLHYALQAMVTYLKDEESGNPYLLIYRFGIDQGKAMLQGLEELLKLTEWVQKYKYTLHISPIRRYFLRSQNNTYEQILQEEFNHWR